MLPDAADVHYNFHIEKKILSCQFYVSFVDEALYFLRHVCKFQSVVNFDCDFSLVHDAAHVHYNFQTVKEILSCPFYVNFAGEIFFFKRCV